MNTLSAHKSEVWPIVARAFPSYSGRKFRIRVATEVSFFDLNWSGGTRSQFGLVRLSDLTGGLAEDLNKPAPWANPVEGATVPMSPGFAVVEHCHFCGKDCGITVHVHPSDAPKLITDRKAIGRAEASSIATAFA